MTTGNRPVWTLTEAVERTGASRSTLRRYLAAGKFPNAYKDTANAWRFPLEDLLAVGLTPTEPANERVQNTSSEQAGNPADDRMNELERALILERTRADNAERLAASYLANVEDLRRAMLMLGAGTSQPGQATEQAQSASTEQVTTAPATLTEPAVSVHETSTGQATPETTKGRPSEPAPLKLLRRLLSRS